MAATNKITYVGVLSEGLTISVKNIASIAGAVVLWLLTIWVPYINVGTTIAIQTMPVELSKGKVISPLFIFDEKYRKYMGEYFTLTGLICMSVFPALLFMLVPGIIISIGWSLAYYILVDKGVAPGEALVRSNNATSGYKWIIFGINVTIGIIFMILAKIFGLIPGTFGTIMILIAFIAVSVYALSCSAVMYRNLTAEDAPAPAATTAEA